MSYENPEQFVDKQSGQHFRRMQESITKAATSTISSYVDTYKRNQIRIQKMLFFGLHQKIQPFNFKT